MSERISAPPPIQPKQFRQSRPWNAPDARNPSQPDMFNLYISPAEFTTYADVVEARVSAEIAFSLGSEYGALFDSDNSSIVGKGATYFAGKSMVTQASSRQIWKGSSASEISFELAFIARDDPKTDVRDKILKLYKMVAPTLSNEKATWQLPGWLKQAGSYLLQPPSPVNLDIPDVISLTNMYITNVQFTQSMKLMRVAGGEGDRKGKSLPMSAMGTITVVPQYMLLREDIEHMFL